MPHYQWNLTITGYRFRINREIHQRNPFLGSWKTIGTIFGDVTYLFIFLSRDQNHSFSSSTRTTKWEGGVLLIILKILNEELMVTFSKVIHEKIKKLKIFNCIFFIGYQYRHSLQTNSSPSPLPLLIFLATSLTYTLLHVSQSFWSLTFTYKIRIFSRSFVQK